MECILITFETAKLAKEKGFKDLCFYHFNDSGKLIEPYLENGSSTDTYFRVDLSDLLDNHNEKHSNKTKYSAPTQSLLQRWLIDMHGIYVLVYLDITLSWIYGIGSLHPKASYTGFHIQSTHVYSSYEEALEIGLQEALKLINNQNESI